MIIVVTGPPCSGKSTYVRQKMKEGDLVIDMDYIAGAIEPHAWSHGFSDITRPVARAARNAAVGELLKRMQGERLITAHIIHTEPSPDMRRTYRSMGAHFVEMNPGMDECLRRLKERPPKNRAVAEPIIREWYAKRVRA